MSTRISLSSPKKKWEWGYSVGKRVIYPPDNDGASSFVLQTSALRAYFCRERGENVVGKQDRWRHWLDDTFYIFCLSSPRDLILILHKSHEHDFPSLSRERAEGNIRSNKVCAKKKKRKKIGQVAIKASGQSQAYLFFALGISSRQYILSSYSSHNNESTKRGKSPTLNSAFEDIIMAGLLNHISSFL